MPRTLNLSDSFKFTSARLESVYVAKRKEKKTKQKKINEKKQRCMDATGAVDEYFYIQRLSRAERNGNDSRACATAGGANVRAKSRAAFRRVTREIRF